MASTTIGVNTLKFGASLEGTTIVRSYEESIKCDVVEIPNGEGVFGAVAFANPNSSANITVISATTGGNIGSEFTLDGNTMLTGMDTLYIESATRNFTNDGFAETQISASGWKNLGLV